MILCGLVIVLVFMTMPGTSRTELALGRKPLGNISNSREIQRPGLDVELLEHRIRSGIFVQAMNTTGLVVQVAEDNRTGWASVLASRADIAVVNPSIALGPRVNLPILYALNAVGALLHHTPTANRDLWV